MKKKEKKKGEKNSADFNPTLTIFLRILRDKTDFPLTTRNRIKSSASGGRTIALDRVLSTEVQLIIVKLDRRYFIRRQERGDDGGRFHGSLTCAEMDRQRVALTQQIHLIILRTKGSNLLIYRKRTLTLQL